jgi:hypothetical protein
MIVSQVRAVTARLPMHNHALSIVCYQVRAVTARLPMHNHVISIVRCQVQAVTARLPMHNHVIFIVRCQVRAVTARRSFANSNVPLSSVDHLYGVDCCSELLYIVVLMRTHVMSLTWVLIWLYPFVVGSSLDV